MKKLLLAIVSLLLFSAPAAFSQHTWSLTNNELKPDPSGVASVGLPADLFFESSTGFRHIKGKSSNGGLVHLANTDFYNGSGMILSGANSSGEVTFVGYCGNNTSSSSTNALFNFVRTSGTSQWDNVMSIRKNGKVVIGQGIIWNNQFNTLSDYKLYVETGIITERLRVAIPGHTHWADYVFADDYCLKPLSEVSEFIKVNKHLPGVPSANEVVKSGIDVAEMDATLLRKIEETTLYMIELEKRVAELTSKIETLQSTSK